MSLKKLKLQRSALKAKLTRYKTFLGNATENDQLEIKDRRSQLEGILEDFEKIQLEIELADESEVNPEDCERELFESEYFAVRKQAENLILKSEQMSTCDSVTNSNLVGTSSVNNPPIKLPVINLPTFSGNYEDWLPFFDTFNSLIHLNESISDTYKFHYLKSALSGSASTVIDSLEISAANYNDAWQILRERYDNKRIIVHKHIQAIHELPATSKENFSSIRRILDGVLKHVRALTAMKRPTQTWCDLLIYLVTSKLDSITVKEWESSLSSNDLPSFKELVDFLTQKCNALETIHKSVNFATPSICKSSHFKKSLTNVTTASLSCPFCNNSHKIYSCKQFLNLSIDERWRGVKGKNLCFNCLQPGHSVSKCSAGHCRTCSRKHNSLLHKEKLNQQTEIKEPQVKGSSTLTTYTFNGHLSTQVLLSTAVIKVYDHKGYSLNCRVLLDSGSQSNLITQELANRLRLPRKAAQIAVTGINRGATTVSHIVNVKIGAVHNKFETNIDCLVLNSISEHIPLISFSKTSVAIPRNLQLADSDFHVSRAIDMLIGADLFYKLLCIGQINIGKGQPILQKTLLGWVLSGSVNQIASEPKIVSCNMITNEQLNASMLKFWEMENCPRRLSLSPEEQFCENHFNNTYKRNADGRFIVSLPIKSNAPELGESRDQAERRFYALERKLSKQPQRKVEYTEFLKEYLELGHMRQLSNDELLRKTKHFYLPHHAVLKESSTTTKLRVVFDGSARSSSGASLNDTLAVGPKLQQDLFEIVARFRTFKIALTADIAKMYRQVLVDKLETPLQRILWRDDSSKILNTFELTTVTYGTASASYLAIKSLQQLAQNEKHEHPAGSEIVMRDFYVDDLLTGADTLEEAVTIRDDVVKLLSKGNFHLRKWGSNHSELLMKGDCNTQSDMITEIDKNEALKTLGLQWNARIDALQFSVHSSDPLKSTSKRKVLSSMSKIFDPLGLISPFTVTAKLFMQKLWTLTIDWDESLPQHLHTEWTQYEKELPNIEELKIPRRVISIEEPEVVEIHGFCDASEQAYGACIYIRAINKQGDTSCNLLCSKSRVAPLKATSLPRLELCGALLLAQLMNKIANSITLRTDKSYYWTDSTIVLSWLQATSKTWKTFVANRISEIQELTHVSDWRHVRTQDNPADIVSRGTSATILQSCHLWWNGPEWLLQPEDYWPITAHPSQQDNEIPERRAVLLTTEAKDKSNPIFASLFAKYSDLNRLIRILAYCLRFQHNIKAHFTSNNDLRRRGTLTVDELNFALAALVKAAQRDSFAKEIYQLKQHGAVEPKSNISSLSPFIDEDGLIKVGGRLLHSDVPHQQKHQALLPSKHPLTELIIRREHLRHLHAGVQATLYHVRENYWPLSARSTVKAVVRKCIVCFRAKPPYSHQIMGNLPKDRVTPARPFENAGVDYFGPFKIKEGRRKNSRTIKAYGAVFVCFATKAVHLEVISDLTTEAFLAALKRFMSRRGKVANLYSDNGTQFVGANRELKELRALFLSEKGKIQDLLANDNVNWHFIPPRTPHFGGLWEAAVKSVKRHLMRVIGNSSLTYEEMTTLLTQIEAILNSRPLSPLSNDPNDLSVLTPAHFLIGSSLTAAAEPTLSHLHVNTLSRWQYVQQIRQHFWQRWSKEYLCQLQTRGKWRANVGPQLEPGALVLLREDNIPSLQWRTGRIEEVFPGADGVSRVATVKTTRGTIRRGASKLCVLPIP